jgi:D-ribose pyranose/furanose isomerase RbsD
MISYVVGVEKMDSDDDESYILEAERKAKQNYLTEEILENNYDPDLFMMFCAEKKEANIDAWTFEDLQECVHQFKMTYRRGDTLKDIQEARAGSEEKSKKKHEVPPPEKPVVKEPEPSVIQPKPTNPPPKQPAPSPNPQTVPKTETVLKAPAASVNPLAAPKTEPVHKEPPPPPTKLQEKPPIKHESVPNTVYATGPVARTNPDSEAKTSEVPLPNESLDKQPYSTYSPAKEPEESKSTDSMKKEEKFSVRCLHAEENDLFRNMPITFNFGDPVLVEGGFFSSNYYVYPVTVLPLNWESRHRFSEYVWLRDSLHMTYAGSLVPPIPSRKSRGTEQQIVKKRRKLLIRFTAALARNSLFLKAIIVEDFFRIGNQKDFAEYQKKNKNRVKKSEFIEQVWSHDGMAHCDLSYQGQRAEKLMEYANMTENIEKKLKRQATSVMEDIKAVQNEYRGLSELVLALAEVQKNLPYTQRLEKLYKELSQTTSYLSEQEELRYGIFEEFFNMYFKFTYLEKDAIKELLKERENWHNEYTKAELKNKNLDRYRSMFGFVNTHSLTDIERVISEQGKIMCEHFIGFSQEKTKITTDLHSIWTKLIESISTI